MLFDPAQKGTLNLLEAASDPVLKSCVKRVVIISSIGAVMCDGTDCETAPKKNGSMVNEECWNETSDINYQPHYHSKVFV